MSEFMEYYNPTKLFIVGKVMFVLNLAIFLRNLWRLPPVIAVLLLIATLSCSLPILFRHRQQSIGDTVFFKRIILPGFLGLTLSILLIAGLVDWARLPYGLSHREAMGLFFESKGMFFLVMSNVALVQMVLQEAIPKGERKPYLLLLVLPLALLLLV